MQSLTSRPVVVASVVACLLILLGSGIAPAAGHQSWLLEVVPGMLLLAGLLALHKRLPFSNLVWVNTAVHMAILAYGGFYTYAETPLGNWAKETFDLSRNHYDRIGHLALGFFPAFIAREVLLAVTPLKRGFWLAFIVVNICNSIGSFWELIEWWTTLGVAGDVGVAFLGSQGDVWDAQWDMFLVLLGAIGTVVGFSGLHDKSMAALAATTTTTTKAPTT